MASLIENSPSNGKEKFKILPKKVIKNHKSRTDIKKESVALVSRLRQASMERRKKEDSNKVNTLKVNEKPEEKNLRIYKALYVTPFDDPKMGEKKLSSLSNQSVCGSSDSNKESLDFFKSILQCNNPKCKKEPENKTKKDKKIDGSKKEKTRKTINFSESPSLHSTSSSSGKGKRQVNKCQSKNGSKILVNPKLSKKQAKKKDSNFRILPSTFSNISTVKTVNLKKEDKNIMNPIPKVSQSLTSPSLTLCPKKSLENKNEISSKSNKSQTDKSLIKVVPESDNFINNVIKKLNEGLSNDIPYIRFTCRNAFTKKIQFKFMHRQNVNLEALKSRLKDKFKFSGHLFYNGKELVGDKKMLSEFSLPLECELDILPQIVSGDYSRQQYTQMSRKLDEKKEFVKNVRDLIGGLEFVDKTDISTKKAIGNFETMNEEERKKFDKNMKEKFVNLKEKRDTKRRTRKSYFSIPIINKDGEKKEKVGSVLSSERISNKLKNDFLITKL